MEALTNMRLTASRWTLPDSTGKLRPTMANLPEDFPKEPAKRSRGRPASGVSREEQFRRASAARRAGHVQLQLLLPPDLNAALEAAAKDHPSGKSAYILDLLTAHLKTPNP